MMMCIGLTIVFSHAGFSFVGAQMQPPAALTGASYLTKEGPMEGVVVSAKKVGSTITVSVVSDKEGHYSFPENRLDPGHYTLKISARSIYSRQPRDRRTHRTQDGNVRSKVA